MRRTVSEPPKLPGLEYQRLLGSGGFADVFLYRQQLPRRDVAIKVLLVDELDRQARDRFVAEANVMAQLSAHPYIVTIFHAAVATGNHPYFVMEYCPGPSLAERYKEQPLEVADALRTGIRIGSAVAAAHAAGILHRDIKPANVLTNGFGWPALTDFGIASTLEGEVPSHTTTTLPRRGGETSTSASVGMSVPWAPPEMFSDDPQPDVRSDVFSLAATIYTVLAGRTPFEVPGRANGTLDLIARIERGAVTPIDRPDVPAALSGVLNRAMSPRRADRYQSIVEFVRALQRIELELGYASTGIELPETHGQRRPQQDAPNADGSGAEGGSDPTRMRPVTTIAAQQAPSAPPVAAPASPPGQDPTRLRGITPLAPQQQPATPASAPAGQQPGPLPSTMLRPRTITAAEQPPTTTGDSAATHPDAADAALDAPARSRRGLVITLVSLAAVVVIAAVAIGIAIAVHPKSPATTAKAHTSTPPGAAVQSVPQPVPVGTPVVSGGTATFTWKNPSPKSGDSYQWQLESSGPATTPTLTTKPTATVHVAAGAATCLDIYTVRAGRLSAELEECTK